MNRSFLLGSLLAWLTVTAGCAPKPVVVVNGFDVYEHVWEETKEAIGDRMQFDTGCEGPLSYRLFSKHGTHPREVGVSGCGERLVYVRLGTGWVLNRRREGALNAEPTAERSVGPNQGSEVGPPAQGTQVGQTSDGRREVRLVLNGDDATVAFVTVPADHPEHAVVHATSLDGADVTSCGRHRFRGPGRVIDVATNGRVALSALRELAEGWVIIELCGHRLSVTNEHFALIREFLHLATAAETPSEPPPVEPPGPPD